MDYLGKALVALQKEEGNSQCADCRADKTEWASVNLGIFICIECAGIHRSIGPPVTQVRSVQLDKWSNHMFETMKAGGNAHAKTIWEANVPPCWIPPKPNSPFVHKEQWIRAKYERKEFLVEVKDADRPYVRGSMEGFLHKKRRQAVDEYQRRFFVLSNENQTLSYYINCGDKKPRGSIPISTINASLCIPGVERSNAMLLMYRTENGRMRNIFVYADSGQVIMDWLCAIRMAKINAAKIVNPKDAADITRDPIMWGELCKTPPQQNKLQKRFFVLDRNCLRYYKSPQEAEPLGEIFLTENDWVDTNVPHQLSHHTNMFMLHTAGREGGGFPFLAQDSIIRDTWMAAIHSAIESVKKYPAVFTIRKNYITDDFVPNGAEQSLSPLTPSTFQFSDIENIWDPSPPA